jgi:hexosaminidase
MKQKKTMMSLLGLVVAVTMQGLAQSPVAVRWEMGQNEAEKGYYSSRFIIKNVSNANLSNNWQLYFNQFSRSLKMPETSPVDIKEVSTTYYQITPNVRYKALNPGDSLVVDMLMRGTMVNKCYRPAGTHLVLDGDTRHPIAVNLEYGLLEKPGQWINHAAYPDGKYSYAYNQAVNNIGDAYTGNDYDIFPMPKQVEIHDGYTAIGNMVTVKGGYFWQRSLKAPVKLLKQQLQQRGIYCLSGQKSVIAVKVNGKLSDNPEYYTLDVAQGKVTIVGASEAGAMNGVKTFIAALDHSKGHNLQNAHVVDYPDLHYRGFMLDIARNFIRLDDIKRYIDILAYYKMNRFQFHFTDDEAWRVEIPGLPELTEVASRRGCTLDEKGYLAQIFDGNGNPDDPTQSANGYLTRAQFIEILKYAHLRGVKVIPEIETPGHARAAIIAMRNRHDKYVATDRTLAEQYRLWDDHDASVYTSAQSYHDNVLNVASDGVYNFITKVVSELQKMYKEAGLKLDIVHLGGDEVASGAWSQSPEVQALMQREHLKDNHEVNGYYIRRITDILYKQGIRIEGWQEVAQNHSAEFNRQMAPRFAGINAWSTVGSRDVVPYSIANDGYPVILSNVTNFYMDMGYNWHPYEQGLHWGGKVDEFDSWSALPWNVYASARMAYDGKPIDVATNHQGKVALANRQNIIGIQAQMWGETIRNFDEVQRMWFPKVFGVAERGWNAQPDWSLDLANTAPYDSARHQYNLKIGTRELPLLHRMGYYFRIGQPGLKVENGMLLANALYPGMAIHYTLDGSEPTPLSPEWTAPVKLTTIPPVIKARAYYLGKESVTTLLWP